MTKLIAFEGIDGCGKTVQANKLFVFLRELNKTVLYLEYPRYGITFAGDKLHGYLNDDGPKPDKESMALWYALDRLDSIKDIESFYSYDYVILNRWTLSSYVYQTNPLWIHYLEYFLFDLPVPNLYLIYDINPTIAAQRKKNQKGKLDANEQDKMKQNLARNRYKTILDEYKTLYVPFQVIQATPDNDEGGRHTSILELSPDEIFLETLQALYSNNILTDAIVKQPDNWPLANLIIN